MGLLNVSLDVSDFIPDSNETTNTNATDDDDVVIRGNEIINRNDLECFNFLKNKILCKFR